MKFALGFDLSLTAPAAVALPLDWRPGDWQRARSYLLKPQAPKTDDTRGQYVRYAEIADWAYNVVDDCGAGDGDTYAIEQYAFSRNNAQASRLMELGGVVRMRLFQEWALVATVVAASSARKLLLGKVPRSDQKIAVQVALYKAGAPLDPKLVEGRVKRPRHATPGKWEENVCDAFVCSNFLLAELGGKVLGVAVADVKGKKKR